MRTTSTLLLFLLGGAVFADGPKDNIPDNVRRIPPPGIKLSAEDRESLETDLKAFAAGIATLEQLDEPLKQLIPDVVVFYKAAHDALKYDEFFNAKEVIVAKNHIKMGMDRLAELRKGTPSWIKQTGLVVRGYRSKIDGSVQPYGLVIPKGYTPGKKIRLDFWCHGRGENLSEVNFIQSCLSSPGQFPSEKAIVCNLYGRYCCANKLAGEIDCLEALEHIKKNYSIDEDRLVMRGFSMGGAACWQFAVHYPTKWCAAAPGAGFSETPDFLKVFQNEDVSNAPWYEKKLWRMYDCTDYALNLYNLPTVAYSGDMDKQKQAADIMAKAMKKEGLELIHIIGPKTGHSYEKGAKAEIIERIDKIADKGRPEIPAKIKFVTYMLRYNECAWIRIDGLDEHWERAQVDAEVTNEGTINITTKNVRQFTIALPAPKEGDPALIRALQVDSQLPKGTARSEKGIAYLTTLVKTDGKWVSGSAPKDDGLSKRPGLQGPIDDAFLDRFLMVKPTGKPMHEAVGKWVDAEMKHATTHWRQQFRGEAPIKADTEVSEADIANSNLILWGDPSSNAIMKKIADKLPIRWSEKEIAYSISSKEKGAPKADHAFSPRDHAVILIYPNPLNPKKYVVLNSGFSYREYDYLNNARQIPKLPDWAIVDVRTPPNSRYPGKIVEADFFGERWEMKKSLR